MECATCHFEVSKESAFCNRCGTKFGDAPVPPPYITTETYQSPGLELSKDQVISGKYRIIEFVGKGGMGIVYKAEDIRLKRMVALKFLRPEYLIDREAKSRFLLEAQASASLDHPNICSVYEINDFQNQTYIAMPFIQGQSLRDKVQAGHLDLGTALSIGIQIADGLAEAHKKGIIHRDIKLANVMMSESNMAKIMDFGLAKLMEGSEITTTAKIMGTVAYMSPEQAQGAPVDRRTDIWSLGIVLYEMLIGHTPFETKRDQAIIYCILNETPKPLRALDPSIPVGVESIVTRCLQKECAARYPDAEELAADLRRSVGTWAAKSKEQSTSPNLPPPGPKKSFLQRVLIPAGAVGAIALTVVLFGLKSKKAAWPGPGIVPISSPAGVPKSSPPRPYFIAAIDPDGRNIKLETQGDTTVEQGATGSIFTKKEFDADGSKRIIGRFVIRTIKDPRPQAEVIERMDVVGVGDYAEMEKEPRGTFIIRADPAETEIYVDVVLKGRTEARLILPPKKYRIVAKKKDFIDRIEDVDLRAKEIVPWTRTLVAKPPPTPLAGNLYVDSTPQNAQVFLDDQSSAVGLTPFNLPLSPEKTHQVRVSLTDYQEMTFGVEVRGGQSREERITLIPLPVELEIVSTPPDAEVFMDDKTVPEGRTTLKKAYPVGRYLLRIHKDGFEDLREEVPLSPGMPVVKKYELRPLPVVRPKYTLIVDSTPEQAAKIFINDQDVGVTPKKIELDESRVRLKIEKPGFKPVLEPIVFTEPELIKTVTLTKLGRGTFSITAYPQARIMIDGVLQDKTVPSEKLFEVEEGRHKIKFIFNDNVEIEKEETVQAQETKRIVCNKDEEASARSARYELTNYPKAVVSLDASTPYDSPKFRTLKVNPGPHRIQYLFKTAEGSFSLNIFDQVDGLGGKKVHAACEILEFASWSPDLRKAVQGKGEGDIILVRAGSPVGVDLQGEARGDAIAGQDFKIATEASDPNLRLGFHLRSGQARCRAEIWILRVSQKRGWKMTFQIEPIS